MKHVLIVIVVMFLMPFSILALKNSNAENRKPEFFSVLEKGQSVILKELPSGYQISIMRGLPAQVGFHTITEIGNDFVVVEMVNIQYRIPIYSIKSITVMKVPNAG